MYNRTYRKHLWQHSIKGVLAPGIQLKDAILASFNWGLRPVGALVFAGIFLLSGCSQEKGVVYESGLTSVSETNGAPESQSGAAVSEELFSETDRVAAGAETDAGNESTIGESSSAGYVYVCGAVQFPGVYPLHEDMRVYEAVALAGGFTEEADEEWLNLAQTVADGERLYVYTREETAAQKESLSANGLAWQEENGTAGDNLSSGTADSGNGGLPEEDGGKVNLNTASREELMTLSGIGGTKADAILDYREEHGSFQSIEEIRNVPGIKNGVYEKIKDQISV